MYYVHTSNFIIKNITKSLQIIKAVIKEISLGEIINITSGILRVILYFE